MRLVLLVLALAIYVYSSSHSEAPGSTSSPRSDLTDLYAFNSYEQGRQGYVTMIANINGLQDTQAGPNYFPISSDYVYNIHVDNTGDGLEDITFQFIPGAFFSGPFDPVRGTGRGLSIGVPRDNPIRTVPVALAHIGSVSAGNEGALNYKEQYQLRVFRGLTSANTNVDNGPFATHQGTSNNIFRKPFDYAGTKSFPDYDAYANSFNYTISIPGCAVPGRVFVGQRAEPFFIALGQVFDLVNLVPADELVPPGDQPAQQDRFNSLKDKAITALTLEVHSSCLTNGSPVVGIWSSVHHLTHQGPTNAHVTGAQKNRLGNPLVNELLIGLTEKDYWNQLPPYQESIFLQYYEYPTIPEIIDLLFRAPVRAAIGGSGSIAPNVYPRVDLREILLHGVPGINTQNLTATGACDSTITNPPYADIIRLNTATPAVPLAQQNPLGVIGLDFAGFPNGRRPIDDVVDIYLRVAMGRICHPPFSTLLGICNPSQAPIGALNITDRAPANPAMFTSVFPYLRSPVPGSRVPCQC